MTENHLVLVDTKKSRGLDGARVERVMELANLAANKVRVRVRVRVERVMET
jgi:glycine/serine hydroxymethyltransferase